MGQVGPPRVGLLRIQDQFKNCLSVDLVSKISVAIQGLDTANVTDSI